MSATVCPNCGGQLFRDLAPRLAGLKPVEPGFRREHLLCQSCWKRQTRFVLVDRLWDERP